MSENKKWKSRLLSSSIPLEYEVGKILSDLDFSVSFDYTYYRKDGEQKKEFSTDIKGHFLFPLNDETNIDAALTLIAECKYREDGKKWLFLPDINKPDLSSFTSGYTIKSLSEFSTSKVKNDLIAKFEEKFEFALKGIEISVTNGEVFDKDIRHGISQLKFALPYLVKNAIENNVFGHIADAKPTYLISILITNADLFVLNENFSVNKIKEVEELDQMAQKVPYLIYYSETGPDFSNHHKEIFEDLRLECESNENLKIFEEFQQMQKDKKYGVYDSPERNISDFEQSFYYTLMKYYSQHFICSFEHFPKLINDILKTLSNVTKKKGGR